MRIFVFEPFGSGHRAAYLRWIVAGILERGWTAVVATRATTLQNPLLAEFQRTAGLELLLLDDVTVHDAAVTWPAILREQLRAWWAMRRALQKARRHGGISAVVIPYLEYIFPLCGLIGPPSGQLPWCGISMRIAVPEGATERQRVPWKWRALEMLLGYASCRSVLVINPSIQEVPNSWLPDSTRSKLRYLPDPVRLVPGFQRDAARSVLQLTPERLAILVYGWIDERKGTDVLASCLASEEELEPYVLIVAGTQGPGMCERFAAAPYSRLREQGRLKFIDHVLDDSEEAMIFAAADIAWLGYVGHEFMSGVLVLAGRVGIPVLGCDTGEIGWMVRRHQIGITVQPSDPRSVRSALVMMMDESFRRSAGQRGLQAFADHTIERSQKLLLGSLAHPATS